MKKYFLILIITFLFSGCVLDKKVKIQYPNIKLKQYGDANKKIEIEAIVRNNNLCLTKQDFNKMLFDISVLRLHQKNYEEQIKLYNDFFKEN